MPLRVFIDTAYAAEEHREYEAADRYQLMRSVDAASSRTIDFEYTPTREGRLLIRLVADIGAPDRMIRRAQVFPVQVGSREFKPRENGLVMQDADGELVISMPSKQLVQ